MADFMKMMGPEMGKKMAGKSSSSPLEDAASDVLAAVKANDAKALAAALQRCYEASAEEGSGPEEE